MKYRNTKTGAVIDSPCKVSGGDWVAEAPKVKEEPEKKEPKKKAVK